MLTNLDFVGSGKPPDAGTLSEGGAHTDGGAGSEGGAHPEGGTHADASKPNLDCDGGCASGQVCEDGLCVCLDDKVECNGSCIESFEDAGYCGRCGVTCRADQSCNDGGCACEGGETDCGSSCVNLTSNPEHCGSCDKHCGTGQHCIQGMCKSSPCDGVCTNPEQLTQNTEGFRKENLGTIEHCFEVAGYKPPGTNTRIVSWNFDSNRTLTVNGNALVSCVGPQGCALPSEEFGWYCVQVGAGDYGDAGLLLPNY